MAVILEPNDKVKRYRVEQLINDGGMATSYKAQHPDGRFVFLKQYKDPTVIVPWYRDYLKYQEAMKRIVESSDFGHYSYEMVEFFEFDDCYYQAIEFVDASQSLGKRLAHATDGSHPIDWRHRLIMAKVFLASLKALHQARIVHSDLKPDNVILIDRETKTGGLPYKLRLIDLDFSLLMDTAAPWHGSYGYFGTPGYFSPEHIQGQTPIVASDVFTCGLMLYELLAKGGHPYLDCEDPEILRGSAPPPVFLEKMPSGNDEVLSVLIRRCLSVELKFTRS